MKDKIHLFDWDTNRSYCGDVPLTDNTPIHFYKDITCDECLQAFTAILPTPNVWDHPVSSNVEVLKLGQIAHVAFTLDDNGIITNMAYGWSSNSAERRVLAKRRRAQKRAFNRKGVL